MCGDSSEYVNEAKKTVCNGVVVVRSLQWPGAFNFFSNGKVSQIYVGNGHKYEEQTFYPVHPPTVNEDPEEYAMMPEPNPTEEPELPRAEKIKAAVEAIWGEYDENENGTLEKAECLKFVNHTLKNMGVEEELTEEVFDQVFDEFDVSKTGNITKEDMASFVDK